MCDDVQAPGSGAVCSECPPGLTGDSQKCYGESYSFSSFVKYKHCSIIINLHSTKGHTLDACSVHRFLHVVA